MSSRKRTIFHRAAGTVAVLVGLAVSTSAWSVPMMRTLYVTDSQNGNIFAVSPGGSVSMLVSEAQIMAATGDISARFTDNGLFFDRATGKLYFTESQSDSVLVRDPSGAISVIASAADITAVTGVSASPEHITLQGGFLYVTDDTPDAVLKIDPGTGTITELTSQSAFEAVSGITSVDLDSGIAVSPDGTTLYVASDSLPDAVFAIDIATGTPTLLATDARFGDLDVFLTVAPNGDVIVADDSGALGDEIFRVTPDGTVSVFLSGPDLEAVVGESTDLEGGLAFDDFGNFYLAEENTDSIYRWSVDDLSAGTIDTSSGALFVSEAAVIAALGLDPLDGIDFEGGIVFGKAVVVGIPEPASLAIFGAALFGLGWAGRRRKAA